MTDEIEWPREIWMAELDEHHNGTGTVVLSEFATVARWEGDKERDCEFQRYVDADIYDSAEKYWRHQVDEMRGLLREASDLLSVERDGLIAGISINGKISDDPDDQPARDAIAEIEDWIARAAASLAQEDA